MNTQQLQVHYAGLDLSQAFTRLCRMVLPDQVELAGKRILDLCCRSGKGCCKFAEHAGVARGGYVLGVDWDPGLVALAQVNAFKAADKGRATGVPMAPIKILKAYPESLRAAGLMPSSFDVAYVNNVFSLLADPAAVLRTIGYTLDEGGVLNLDVALASAPLPAELREAARGVSNSIQASFTADELHGMLEEAGFPAEGITVTLGEELDPAMGVTPDVRVATVPAIDALVAAGVLRFNAASVIARL